MFPCLRSRWACCVKGLDPFIWEKCKSICLGGGAQGPSYTNIADGRMHIG